MIFDALYESAQRGELLLIDGGLCHWHIRRDGQLTIREIISTRRGAGSEMLKMLRRFAHILGARSILAKCPADLPSNAWYDFAQTPVDDSDFGALYRQLAAWSS